MGWPRLTAERRWMAAVLSCGEGAALSHRSAAALIRNGLRTRSRPSLPAEDVAEHRGIPATGPARTILDLATVAHPSQVERAVNEADKLELITPEALWARLTGFRGQPGVRALRLLLERDSFRLSDSDLEVRFRRIAESVGLPPPLTKHRLNGFEVDFYWPGIGLVVETDGLRYHRTPAAQARDRLRDQAHTAAGLTTLRFTHRQIRHEGAHVQRVLRATAARQLPRL